MNSWCESCARKNWCYVVDVRPKCFVPITNTAKVEWVYNKRERLWYPYSNGELLFKDDPNSSEKPNNCDTCKYGEDKHRYAHICNECGVGINNYEPKTFPTISKMEQVEDEPQTCDTCKYGEDKHRYAHICNECGVGINNYEPKDEPQDECAKEYEELGLRKLKELRKDEPQTEREGEWIWDEQILGLVCSECKELGVERSNFCPNCGAKMKGADDE